MVPAEKALGRARATALVSPGRPHSSKLWAPLSGKAGDKGAANAIVALSGPFHFRSDQVSATAVAGPHARLEGTGRFNGRGGYRFVIEARDGGGITGEAPDRLTVRITHRDGATGVEMVDFDSGAQSKARGDDTVDRSIVATGGISLRN